MGNFVSCIATGVGYCFCTSCSSLCSSCLGNDKPSTVPPSTKSGRKRSVLLLILSLSFALAFQYGLAPALLDHEKAITTLNPVGRYLVNSWTDGCHFEDEELEYRCSGNAGVLRAASSSVLFFLLAGVAAYFRPTSNREAWPAKYALFCFLVACTVFIPNKPLFYDIFLHLSRIGASVFVVYQQIILIDVAYCWNDAWVERANQADYEEEGSGRKWLAAILISSGILFTGSLAVITFLYQTFASGCATNTVFITISLILPLITTVAQLLTKEGSLLTSAVVMAYATYLLFAALSKNPDTECNPLLGDVNVLNIGLGLAFTVLSLAWTGLSVTSDDASSTASPVYNHNPIMDFEDPSTSLLDSVQISSPKSNDSSSSVSSTTATAQYMLNVLLSLVSCWYAMALTSWGTIHTTGGNVANPNVGSVSMWMIMVCQWTALVLYLWTLVAPKLFPDRDFS